MSKHYKPKTTCAFCGTKLENVLFFCRPCWFALPGGERASVQAMNARGQDLTSKIAKCVRILKEKRAA